MSERKKAFVDRRYDARLKGASRIFKAHVPTGVETTPGWRAARPAFHLPGSRNPRKVGR